MPNRVPVPLDEDRRAVGELPFNEASLAADGPTVLNRILIHSGFIATMDDAGTTRPRGWVHIMGDRFSAVGEGQPPVDVVNASDTLINAEGKVVLPGLVNPHTHLEQVFVRNLSYGQDLNGWLQQYVEPMQLTMTADELRQACL